MFPPPPTATTSPYYASISTITAFYCSFLVISHLMRNLRSFCNISLVYMLTTLATPRVKAWPLRCTPSPLPTKDFSNRQIAGLLPLKGAREGCHWCAHKMLTFLGCTSRSTAHTDTLSHFSAMSTLPTVDQRGRAQKAGLLRSGTSAHSLLSDKALFFTISVARGMLMPRWRRRGFSRRRGACAICLWGGSTWLT